MRTKRWTRSPRGEVLGVATGLAEWKGMPPSTVRIIFLIIILFSGIFPGAAVYLILACILPVQTADDVIDSYSEAQAKPFRFDKSCVADASFREEGASERMRREREKERDWENRFNS